MRNIRKKTLARFALIFALLLISLLSSCVTLSRRKISRTIYDSGTRSIVQLAEFFLSHNADANREEVLKMAVYYVEEAAAEGINSDVAWVQMCHETNFLRFGNLVQKEQNNFCGLGATGPGHPGESFETAQLGVRAHIQHLHAYGTTEDIQLKNECIDRRYKYVIPRGKAKDIYGLTNTWAMDSLYAQSLDRYLTELEKF